MRKEERLRQEAQAEVARLGSLQGDFEAREQHYKTDLVLAQKNLPSLLGRWAVGEVKREEVDGLKLRIRLYEDRLPEFEAIFEGLEQRIRQANANIRKADKLLKKRETYEGLREHLRSFPTDHEARHDLLSYAKELDEVEGAKLFLAELNEKGA